MLGHTFGLFLCPYINNYGCHIRVLFALRSECFEFLAKRDMTAVFLSKRQKLKVTMKENQTKSLMARLFGKNVPTDNCPKCLFREEWTEKQDTTLRDLARLIKTLIPECVVKAYTSQAGAMLYDVEDAILHDLRWNRNDNILAPWLKENPEPIMTRNEFIHYLVEYLLSQEKGGEQ